MNIIYVFLVGLFCAVNAKYLPEEINSLVIPISRVKRSEDFMSSESSDEDDYDYCDGNCPLQLSNARVHEDENNKNKIEKNNRLNEEDKKQEILIVGNEQQNDESRKFEKKNQEEEIKKAKTLKAEEKKPQQTEATIKNSKILMQENIKELQNRQEIEDNHNNKKSQKKENIPKQNDFYLIIYRDKKKLENEDQITQNENKQEDTLENKEDIIIENKETLLRKNEFSVKSQQDKQKKLDDKERLKENEKKDKAIINNMEENDEKQIYAEDQKKTNEEMVLKENESNLENSQNDDKRLQHEEDIKDNEDENKNKGKQTPGEESTGDEKRKIGRQNIKNKEEKKRQWKIMRPDFSSKLTSQHKNNRNNGYLPANYGKTVLRPKLIRSSLKNDKVTNTNNLNKAHSFGSDESTKRLSSYKALDNVPAKSDVNTPLNGSLINPLSDTKQIGSPDISADPQSSGKENSNTNSYTVESDSSTSELGDAVKNIYSDHGDSQMDNSHSKHKELADLPSSLLSADAILASKTDSGSSPNTDHVSHSSSDGWNNDYSPTSQPSTGSSNPGSLSDNAYLPDNTISNSALKDTSTYLSDNVSPNVETSSTIETGKNIFENKDATGLPHDGSSNADVYDTSAYNKGLAGLPSSLSSADATFASKSDSGSPLNTDHGSQSTSNNWNNDYSAASQPSSGSSSTGSVSDNAHLLDDTIGNSAIKENSISDNASPGAETSSKKGTGKNNFGNEDANARSSDADVHSPSGYNKGSADLPGSLLSADAILASKSDSGVPPNTSNGLQSTSDNWNNDYTPASQTFTESSKFGSGSNNGGLSSNNAGDAAINSDNFLSNGNTLSTEATVKNEFGTEDTAAWPNTKPLDADAYESANTNMGNDSIPSASKDLVESGSAPSSASDGLHPNTISGGTFENEKPSGWSEDSLSTTDNLGIKSSSKDQDHPSSSGPAESTTNLDSDKWSGADTVSSVPILSEPSNTGIASGWADNPLDSSIAGGNVERVNTNPSGTSDFDYNNIDTNSAGTEKAVSESIPTK